MTPADVLLDFAVGVSLEQPEDEASERAAFTGRPLLDACPEIGIDIAQDVRGHLEPLFRREQFRAIWRPAGAPCRMADLGQCGECGTTVAIGLKRLSRLVDVDAHVVAPGCIHLGAVYVCDSGNGIKCGLYGLVLEVAACGED